MNPSTPAGGLAFPTVPTVIFAHWREVLNRCALPEAARNGYSLAIGGYLDYWREKAGAGGEEPVRLLAPEATAG